MYCTLNTIVSKTDSINNHDRAPVKTCLQPFKKLPREVEMSLACMRHAYSMSWAHKTVETSIDPHKEIHLTPTHTDTHTCLQPH